MEPKLTEVILKTTETINGYKMVKMYHNRAEINSKISVYLEIDLYDCKNDFIRTESFRGSLDSTVKDIKAIFTEDINVFIHDHGAMYILDDSQRPLFKCFEICKHAIKSSFKTFVKAKLKPQQITFLPGGIINFYMLRKLIVEHIPIHSISLEHLRFLRYLKLINNNLKSISMPKNMLEFCDLRSNCLKCCAVQSKVLILQNNEIAKFVSRFCFKYLNLSNNPLKTIDCSCEFLNIRNTEIAHSLECDSKIILADGVEKIKIGKCPSMRVLYISDCQLTQIGNVIQNLRLFKARNNYFQSLPKLKKCAVIDVSGNFLESIRASNVVFLNISKNQVREIDLKRFASLQHLNLSFNPLEKIFNEKAVKQPRSIILNSSTNLTSTVLTYKSVKRHDCAKRNFLLAQHKMETAIGGVPITIFILSKSIAKLAACEIFSSALSRSAHTNSLLDIFCDFSEYCYKKLCAMEPRIELSFTFITSRHVFLRSFSLPLFFCNFSEMDVLVEPENIRVFNNVSNWCTFPILCRYQPLITKRSYSFFRHKADYNELFQFNDFFCAKTLEFFVANTPEFSSTQKSDFGIECKLVKEIHTKFYRENFMKRLQELMSHHSNPQYELLGFKNIDFNINHNGLDSAGLSTTNPVFLYMQLHFESFIDQILWVEELNLVQIIDFYAKVFRGRVVEKNYKLFIIGFNNPLHSALFGLKIQKILRPVGIEVGIGIADDVVFRTEQDGIMYFGGPVFNKTSRIANLGIGVFCCGCVKLFSPLIETIDEGERYLKGFNKRHRIFSLKLTNVYDNLQ
ncbi:uncharacterized protein VICG_00106 [Vittaforma corneae ATCC 50505]|uniref:Uncharacterized protein n=1 Tax=Vittaforma corneae (strain ATCC 50505) TaxID=993615 RepID=L2GPM8_VITCO|nr:uncharacterized protein VICG_00106 [Vittaforma corneae ATCC 50505]ELA42791.1 hypothetical protein VICG_00106 [Vittaforma corneae ATCC 50505]